MRFFQNIHVLILASTLAIVGCSSVHRDASTPEHEFASPRQVMGGGAVSPSIPMPQIETANKIAKIDVRERIKGFACSGRESNPAIPKDLYFLKDQGFDLSTAEGQAKAAAAFDALFGKVQPSKDGSKEVAPYYSDDILIAPSYLVQTRRLSPFSTEVCVKVVGYRGVVTGFEDSTIRRSSDGKEINPNKIPSPEGSKGSFSITVF